MSYNNYNVKNNSKSNKRRVEQMEELNHNAAGIDIGDKSHFVAVPAGRSEDKVREFSSVTRGLNEIVSWLKECGVDTVAMESTSVYWIPLYEILEDNGFEVVLVNARHVKNVPGRKTDVLDCMWIQKLHACGLLRGAFRPKGEILKLRTYYRQRQNFIQQRSPLVLQMQKMLQLMNLKVTKVLADISCGTGMKIVRAIAAGNTDPLDLVKLRGSRCVSTPMQFLDALTGTYREENVRSLQHILTLYDHMTDTIKQIEADIQAVLSSLEKSTPQVSADAEQLSPQKCRKKKNSIGGRVPEQLARLFGVPLTDVPGVGEGAAMSILSEIGTDVSAWKSAKHFSSWLGLCPGNKISGGKRLSGRRSHSANRIATALRMAAGSLYANKSALGALFRRLRSKLGAPKAITAVAHRLAVIIWNMLHTGKPYNDLGQDYYEKRYKNRVRRNLERRAREMGLQLVEAQ